MSIPEDILNRIKCCLSDDGHIAIEPIPVSCGAIGCKQCILRSNNEEIDCYSCRGKNFKITPVIKPNEYSIKSYVSDLFEYVKVNLDKEVSSLEGKIEKIFSLMVNY
jgi:hypothetical protein